MQNNLFASESPLYIFSDGPKAGDEATVQEVRDYIKTITGFKSVHIFERSSNNRPYNNRQGQRYLADTYGKFIFLEDDLVTSPFFLQYINEGLELYKDNNNITAICGYTPPIEMPSNYSHDTFLDPTFSSWGFGMWKNRYDNIEIPIRGFQSFIEDEHQRKEFLKLGSSLLNLVEADHEGRIDALDIKILFQQFKEKKYTVLPKFSLVQNIGWDGSGEHCGATTRFDVDLSKNITPIRFFGDLQVDNSVLSALREFRDTQSKKKW